MLVSQQDQRIYMQRESCVTLASVCTSSAFEKFQQHAGSVFQVEWQAYKVLVRMLLF